MSKIALEGNASGTGTFTIAAPNSNSNYTLTLPTSSGTVVTTGGAQTIEFAAGSAAAPSITTTGDTNTGIFFPAADTIAFAEGGAEAMRITSTGTVAIGTTTTPTAKLWVDSGRVGLTNTYKLGWHSNPAHGDLANYITGDDGSNYVAIGTNGSERMRIDSSGNVGIGASPASSTTRLTIYDNTNSGILFLSRDAGQQRGILAFGRLNSGSAQTVARIVGDSDNTSGNNGVMTFWTANASGTITERARITSGGYFKASNDGSYVGSTGDYHEFTQTANSVCMWVAPTNASYTDAGMDIRAVRSATSSYKFLLCESSNGADLEFNLRGDGNGYADGTWNNNGADYAEFFESANGQALMLGATVVLEGTKVREATAQDDPKNIIGVVRPKEPSKASMVVGNTAWNKWANKYLTDDFDRYIMEDHDVVEWEEQVLEKEAVAAVEAVLDEEGNEVSAAIPAQEAVYKTVQHSYESHNIPAGITVPANAVRKTHDDKGNKFQHYKLNPAWDKDAEYTPREKRPEWNIIGLLGQVKILKGQPVSDRWIKMRDVSATVEEWMIR